MQVLVEHMVFKPHNRPGLFWVMDDAILLQELEEKLHFHFTPVIVHKYVATFAHKYIY